MTTEQLESKSNWELDHVVTACESIMERALAWGHQEVWEHYLDLANRACLVIERRLGIPLQVFVADETSEDQAFDVAVVLENYADARLAVEAARA